MSIFQLPGKVFTSDILSPITVFFPCNEEYILIFFVYFVNSPASISTYYVALIKNFTNQTYVSISLNLTNFIHMGKDKVFLTSRFCKYD